MCKIWSSFSSENEMFPTIVLFSFLISGSKGIFVSDLYPFGTTWGDKVLDTQNLEDVSSQEIKLNTSVKFFDRDYDSIFVSTLIIWFINI